MPWKHPGVLPLASFQMFFNLLKSEPPRKPGARRPNGAGGPEGQRAPLSRPARLAAGRALCLPLRTLDPPPFRVRCPLTAMAAASAAAGAGEPLSPDELLPKGDAEKTEEELEEDDDDELDETLSERLWGLTEMFPERVRSAAGATFDLSLFVAQKMYRFSRAALWIGTTSFMILVLPVVFETEKLQMEQQQQLQQRQILLGPNTGLSGGMPGPLPSLPGKI
ncbi:mitochondrial import receptor subunit TOM22 homolog [Heterocephalus glaber]|uniref:Mitochondrial import receptor subunit TOM22 homolog n=3 Tax=Heterocephalus glaber TaxID=10181 RepID=A0AAX6P7R2_HETGA|nr:mitochondrial import receptor subunit TOM22 homolog [Heterocephalus glaber]